MIHHPHNQVDSEENDVDNDVGYNVGNIVGSDEDFYG